MGLSPTNALPSDSLEALVRAHFGLSQAELAHYLGVSPSLVAYFESGRRRATPAASQRLNCLADLLPPPDGTGPTAPVFAKLAVPAAPAAEALAPLPDFGPLAAKPLQARQLSAAAQARAAFRTAVDLQQAKVQVDALKQAQVEVNAHRAALSA